MVELFRYLFTVISPEDATVLMNIHIQFYGKPMGVSSNVNMFVVLGTGTRVPEYLFGSFITRLLSTQQCPYGCEFGAIYNVYD